MLPALNLEQPDYTFNGKDVPWLLAHRAEVSGDQEFLTWVPRDDAERTWTYAQFWTDVRKVAAGLSKRGIAKGDRLLLHCDNCPEMLITWYACAVLGAIAVTTNTRCVGEELSYFAEHSGAVAAVTMPHLFDELKANTAGLSWYVVVGDDWDELLQHDEIAQRRPAEPLLPAGIQYTSGTTARPKAVIHTHANVLWGARSAAENMAITPSDRYLVNMPLFHTHAQGWNVWPMLWAGGRVVLQPKFSASAFWDVSMRHGCTLTSLQPFGLKAIAKYEMPKHHYRTLFFGARSRDIEKLFGAPTYSAWGMTETITGGLRREMAIDIPDGAIGTPAPGYQIAVVDPVTGKHVGAREIGDLYIRGTRGIQLTAGYFNSDEANEKAFTEDGWFQTGDQVWIDEEGFYYFADRDKDVLRVGGENVSARQIEALLITQLGPVDLHSVAVIASPHDMLTEVPVVFVKLNDEANTRRGEIEDKIHAICAKDLADFKRPRAVYFIDEMPTGLLDKIDKKALRIRATELAPAEGLPLP